MGPRTKRERESDQEVARRKKARGSKISHLRTLARLSATALNPSAQRDLAKTAGSLAVIEIEASSSRPERTN